MEDCEVFLVASYLRHVEDRVDFLQISFIIFRDFRFVQKKSGHNESKRGTDRNNNLPYLGILL